MKSVLFRQVILGMIFFSVAAIAQSAELTPVVRGAAGEIITITYKKTETPAGNRPNLNAEIRGLSLQTSERMEYRGARVTAAFLLSSNADDRQVVIELDCNSQSDRTTYCQNSSATPLATLTVGSLGQSTPYPVNLSVVFKGRPVLDSFDGKPYFVLQAF